MYRTGAPAVAILVAVALASCGGGGASSSGTTAQPKPGQRTTADAGAKAGDACQDRLAEFVARMDDLRQSLVAGLSYAEYVVRVKAIRAAYEAVPIDKLGAGCLVGPAGEAEDAFNQYLRAANVWGECAGTAGCAASEIEGKLQRRWRIASKSLEAAGS